jgi:hypothetical protein
MEVEDISSDTEDVVEVTPSSSIVEASAKQTDANQCEYFK